MGHIFTVWNHTENKHDFLEGKNQILDSIAILLDPCVSEPQNDRVCLLVLKCLTFFQCDLFIQEGARLGRTPAEVVSMCDITFSCVSDPKAARDVSTSLTQVNVFLQKC